MINHTTKHPKSQGKKAIAGEKENNHYLLTIFKSTKPARLSKRFQRGPNGELEKISGGNMIEGRFRCVAVDDMTALAAEIDALSPAMAACYGVTDFDDGQIVTEKRLKNGNFSVHTIARTTNYFRWHDGAAIMMFDYDSGDLTIPEYLSHMYALWPALREAPHLARPSASSYIYDETTGEELRGLTGIRLLVGVVDGRDIERAGQALYVRSWLAGYGHFVRSKAPKDGKGPAALERSRLIDKSVWQPNRFDFLGGAECGPGLVQKMPETLVLNSQSPGDSTGETIPDITPEEKEWFQELQREEKRKVAPERAELDEKRQAAATQRKRRTGKYIGGNLEEVFAALKNRWDVALAPYLSGAGIAGPVGCSGGWLTYSTPGEHSSRTQFNLNPENGRWHDYRDDSGGGPIDFLEKYCGVSRRDAARIFAELAGIALERGRRRVEPLPEVEPEGDSDETSIAERVNLAGILPILGIEPDAVNLPCPNDRSKTTFRQTRQPWDCECGATHDAIDYFMLAQGLRTRAGAIARLQKKIAKDAEMIADNGPDESEAQAAPLSTTQKDVLEWLCSLHEKTVAWLEALTGVGKSHIMREAIVYLVTERAEKVLYSCDTLKSMTMQARKLVDMAKKRGHKISASFLAHGEDENLDADIVMTTHGYFGRRGESTGGYAKVHEAIEGRYCFGDEIQQFHAQKMRYSLPLAYRVAGSGQPDTPADTEDTESPQATGSGHERSFTRISKCRITAHTGGCNGCNLCFARKEGKHQSEFYHSFPARHLDYYQSYPALPAELAPARLLDRHQYFNAVGTTYLQEISHGATIPGKLTGSQLEKNFHAYVSSLLSLSRNVQVRAQFPTIPPDPNDQAARPTPAAPVATAEGVKLPEEAWTPAAPCAVPRLVGNDLFALLQLFESHLTYFSKAKEKHCGDGEIERDYRGAKAIVMASATPAPALLKAVELVAGRKGWTLEQKRIDEIPFSFNVTQLKTSRAFSDGLLKRLAQRFCVGGGVLGLKEPVKAMVLYRNKADAKNGYYRINEAKAMQQAGMLFCDGDFNRDGGTSQREPIEWQVIVTYPRAAITRGFDYPELQVFVINCQALLPTLALDELRPGMNFDERNELLLADLQNEVDQILGRGFRSLLERMPGQTVYDPRQIVVVFHGLPEWAERLTVKKELVKVFREYGDGDGRESWLSALQSDVEESALDSLGRVLAGEAPQNWNGIDNERAAAKAAQKSGPGVSGASRLTRRQRAKLAGKDNGANYDSLAASVAKAVVAGAKWRDISHRLHLSRQNSDDRKKLKMIYDEGQKK